MAAALFAAKQIFFSHFVDNPSFAAKEEGTAKHFTPAISPLLLLE
jgi:hypothetical protein